MDLLTDEGWKLYPLISFVRDQVLQLQNVDKYVLVKKLPREQNVADSIRVCMRNERESGWPRRTHIPLIDAVPRLSERIHLVSEKSKMVADGVRIARSVDDIGEVLSERTYVRQSLMDAGSLQICYNLWHWMGDHFTL